jgi:hypothetical protein
MTEPPKMCACGKPLHYSCSAVQLLIEEQIADLGECIKVSLESGRAFMVPRHFIALHGLKASALPELAEKLGFKELWERQSE